MRTLVWFKKDLRLLDNPALYHASKQSTDGVLAVYIIDSEMWLKHGISPSQIDFILGGLKQLSVDLEKLHIPFMVISVDQTRAIPATLLRVVEEVKADKLFFNLEYEVDESRRDNSVVEYLKQHHIPSQTYTDQLILPHELVKTNQNEYFKVFTAFKRQWLKHFSLVQPKSLPKPSAQSPLAILSTEVPLVAQNNIWPPGEREAYARLKKFTKTEILVYQKQRDYPFLDSTSRLSPYLATGMISAKECFLAALAVNSGELDTGNLGTLTWMSELIWREFYRHILIYVPRVCMNKAYNLKTEMLPWKYDEALLNAWKQGQTGFPIVDAAMRQLNMTGWMHNRLRMVVAMFLSKNLFLDWRLGERYFTEKLIDFDFASNNGGWQWSASTGTDSVPYFRVFNPTLQSERFDPTGEFIRQYCPEISMLEGKVIHNPYAYLSHDIDYPPPIIDYKKSRADVINEFKKI